MACLSVYGLIAHYVVQKTSLRVQGKRFRFTWNSIFVKGAILRDVLYSSAVVLLTLFLTGITLAIAIPVLGIGR